MRNKELTKGLAMRNNKGTNEESNRHQCHAKRSCSENVARVPATPSSNTYSIRKSLIDIFALQQETVNYCVKNLDFDSIENCFQVGTF